MVHNIVGKGSMSIIFELVVCGFAEEVHLTEEETERVEPWEQNTSDDLPDTLFAETQVVATHNG